MNPKAKAALSCTLAVLAAVPLAGCGQPSSSMPAAPRPAAPSIAWGEPVKGLQAGISIKKATGGPYSDVKLVFHLRNAGVKPRRILKLSAARNYCTYWQSMRHVEVKAGGRIVPNRRPYMSLPGPSLPQKMSSISDLASAIRPLGV